MTDKYNYYKYYVNGFWISGLWFASNGWVVQYMSIKSHRTVITQ